MRITIASVVLAFVGAALSAPYNPSWLHEYIDISPLHPCLVRSLLVSNQPCSMLTSSQQGCMEANKKKWDYTKMSRYDFCEYNYFPGAHVWLHETVAKCTAKKCTHDDYLQNRMGILIISSHPSVDSDTNDLSSIQGHGSKKSAASNLDERFTFSDIRLAPLVSRFQRRLWPFSTKDDKLNVLISRMLQGLLDLVGCRHTRRHDHMLQWDLHLYDLA
ncbi:uncharacterized protein K452DRAFT_345176 [Aplosporella prunicola CBS 121167]|uniref:Cyanovirin-N domain-containing protein n=1 Tax=Aplosporella prunicola CBS 121167 TaxID=1176127 RepID=A0A6A6AXM0_9PEZI|nr:uncharacterized protein K452DRAFT_345176 [Aplosporella prunicola CBS 121167]KAF2135998.1 hypothetical protein K452DRAFT_345176 [Aplosporella prunicola CBS 121167]